MRDRDVDKPREKIAAAGSSPLSPLEFGSRHRPIHRSIAKPTISPFLFPPPFQSHLKLRLAVETYINSLHLFSSTLSLSLSPLFFGLPPSLFLLLALASNVRPGGTNYRPVSHEAAKSISAYT